MKSRGTGETAEYDLVGTLSRKARDGKWKTEDGLREKYVFYATSSPGMDIPLYAYSHREMLQGARPGICGKGRPSRT